jgi:putative Ca2+/H+ antiporter (TMEM165/GDT1 family)
MMRELLIMFFTIFVAELGDKTQVATLIFAAEGKTRPLAVFAASAGALALGAAVSVIVGTTASRFLDHVPVKLIAGVGFILIGVWSIAQHFRG